MSDAPKKHQDFMRLEEVSGGINVIIDDRFGAFFPMEQYEQVNHLVESANLAFRQRVTFAQKELERRSWVIGEMMLEHPDMSREQAEELANQIGL